MSRITIIIGTAIYVFLCLYTANFWVSEELAFVGDGQTYSLGAVNILKLQMYSQDGIRPFIEREPVYSFFIAPIYAIFGEWNAWAIFAVQAILYWVCVLVFCKVLSRASGKRVASLCFFLLLTSPSVFHALFIVYREAFVLSLLMLLSALLLSYSGKLDVSKTILIGLLLGLLPLTYYSFILLPVIVLLYLWYKRIPAVSLCAIFLLTFVIIAAWGLRNQRIDGKFRIAGYDRSAVMWYVRAEQAEKVRGFEPLRCLWSEYVTRDWTGRSEACSFNSVMHAKWPEGASGLDASVAPQAIARIQTHLGSYLWFSMFEILELHLPFVGGGWPFTFNVLAAIGSLIVYAGCALAWRMIFDRRFVLFTLIIVYTTAVFIFTDATPRYLVPVTFCYAVFAAVGYDKLLTRLGFPVRSS